MWEKKVTGRNTERIEERKKENGRQQVRQRENRANGEVKMRSDI